MSRRRNKVGRFKRHQFKRAREAGFNSKPPLPRSEAEILADLRTLCREPGFAHVIANAIIRDNFILYRDEMKSSDLNNLYGFERLIRTEVTMLIGYMVQGGADTVDQLPTDPKALLVRAENLLSELHSRLNSRWNESLSGEPLEAFQEHQAQAEALREPIFYGGESAFGFQYQDFSLEKYQADNDWLSRNKGFTIDQASRVFGSILEIQDEQIGGRFKALSAKDSNEWSMLPALVIEKTDVEARSSLPPTIVEAVLDALSMPLGSNLGFRKLGDFNQAAALPLIALGNERFVAFQHYALVEALYDAPFYWMGQDDAYKDKASKHRGDFTEVFTLRRLQSVFGATNVHRGLELYRGKDCLGEIDILVEFGGRLLLVQAKSKKLSLAARHGNDAILRDDFKKAVQQAYDQSLCCAEALFESNVRIKTSDGRSFFLKDRPTEVYPMCLVADHYPGLVTQVDRFLEKRSIENVANPIVTDIFALDALCEMLDRPLRFLGYLELRDQFAERLIYSHELILLSYHLKQNLWIQEDYTCALLDDTIGADLEIAMLARRRGIAGAKTPKGPLTAFQGTTFEATLSRIEGRPNPAMVDFALFMLEASGATIKAFNDAAAMIVDQSRSDLRVHDFSLAVGTAGITVHCSYDPPGEAMRRLEVHVEGRKYATRSDCWYGLFLSPDDGLPIAGVKLDFAWTEDAERAAIAATLPAQGKGRNLLAALRNSKRRSK